jgi:hypothetical protein
MPLCLRQSDLQIAPNEIQFQQVDPSMDQRFAVRAEASEVTGGRRYRDVVHHLQSRHLWRAAFDAIDKPRPTSLLGFPSPGLQEIREIKARDQERTPIVDDREALFDPQPHRVFMDAEVLGDLFHCVISVDFDESVVGGGSFSEPMIRCGPWAHRGCFAAV